MEPVRKMSGRLRLTVAIAALSLVALAPSSSVAAPPPGEPIPILPITSATMLSAVIPVEANSTYRSLLPSGFAPAADPGNALNPNRPAVKLTGLNLTLADGQTTYESYAMLRSRYCSQNGWYNRGDGVISDAIMDWGNSIGGAKYRIDADSNLAQTSNPDVWRSSAKLDGTAFVTLTWRRDPIELAVLLGKQPWQLGWLRGDGAPFEQFWDTFPVSNTDTGMVNWLDGQNPDSANPPQWNNRVGVVTVQVRQGVDPSRTYGDWMSLVPKTIKVPGVLQSFNQGTNYLTMQPAALGAC